MKHEVELPELPGNMWWETVSIPANGKVYIQMRIYKRMLWIFKKRMVESDIITIEPGPPEEMEAAIHMNCDMLILQLPDAMHIEVVQEEA